MNVILFVELTAWWLIYAPALIWRAFVEGIGKRMLSSSSTMMFLGRVRRHDT